MTSACYKENYLNISHNNGAKLKLESLYNELYYNTFLLKAAQ